MSPLEERLRRLEDAAAIRTLDATCCRLLDDVDWPALVALVTEDGVFDGLSRVRGHRDLLMFSGGLADAGMSVFWHHDGIAHVASGRYADELTHAGEGWRYRVEQVRFSYRAPLAEGLDRHRFALESARSAAVARRTPA
ncbi:hypothetical protein JOD57_004349 [Geodermatophilus bullaregiensis]|uniref:nuclear transport factor 2 family protein n=1 Tax=Geodermatophilus bullaregiensis TaxID=1564160 RepID=UPI00195DF9B2|nr:nuclear transport factor 2 family protein [Geodermatophilus bullaregiensis]MBM7808512.1 hypothetical protein [Geodermatophilus bullaregiensis]